MSIPVSPTFTINPGETPGQFIARIVSELDGCSVSVNRQKLASLVCRGIEDEVR